MASIPEKMISSSDGVRPIPVIGLGTAAPLEDGNVVSPAVPVEAMKVGYRFFGSVSPVVLVDAMKVGNRHFDSAAIYGSEKPLGEAITEALRQGVIKSRTELFITTKLWCNKTEGHLVLPAMKQSLANLGLDYVDLYLIHFPINLKQEELELPVPKECIAAMDVKAVWEAMEDCQNRGLTKSIGVSNFSIQKIEEILSFAKIPPAVNQVEMNPLWQQRKLNGFCKENGIHITAYSALGAFGNPQWGHNHVMECGVLQDIAKSKEKTIAQISLRWLYEQGVSITVKSFNTERMKQNLDIFNWSLTEEESNKISQIPQRRNVFLIGLFTNEHNDVMAEIDAELG